MGYSSKYDIPLSYAGPLNSGTSLVYKKFTDSEHQTDKLALYLNSACFGERQEYMKEFIQRMFVCLFHLIWFV